MILLFAGLFVLGVYTVVYAFDLFDYKLAIVCPSLDFTEGPRELREQRGGRQPLGRDGNLLVAAGDTRPDPGSSPS